MIDVLLDMIADMVEILTDYEDGVIEILNNAYNELVGLETDIG